MPQLSMHLLIGISSLFKVLLRRSCGAPFRYPSALALRYISRYTPCLGYLHFGAVHDGRKSPAA